MDQTRQNSFLMTVDDKTSDSVTTVTLAGRLETTTVPEFKNEIVRLADNGQIRLVFDCSPLRFLDSSGLGAMVSLLRMLSQKQGDIKLAGLSPEVKSLFMLTRLNKVFEIHETAQSALSAFA